MNRRRMIGAGRALLYLAVLGFLLVRLWQARAGVAQDVQRVGALRAGLAGVAVLAGTIPAMLGWRTLLAGLGTRLDLSAASRIYFVGGLGKYLPGGLWPMLTQADLARRLGEPPARFSVAFPISVAVSALGGGAIGLLAVPWRFRAGPVGWLAGAASAVLLLGGTPLLVRLLVRLARRLLARHGAAAIAVPGHGVVLRALGWIGLGWVLSGLHVTVLAGALGAGADAALLCLAGYCLSTVVGMLAVVLPAGLGVRELALAMTLVAALSGSALWTVLALSRFLVTGADVLAAIAAAGCAGGRRRAASPEPLAVSELPGSRRRAVRPPR